MKEYRILFRKGMYVPQAKVWWWPWWGEYSALMDSFVEFETQKEAEDFLQKAIKYDETKSQPTSIVRNY